MYKMSGYSNRFLSFPGVFSVTCRCFVFYFCREGSRISINSKSNLHARGMTSHLIIVDYYMVSFRHFFFSVFTNLIFGLTARCTHATVVMVDFIFIFVYVHVIRSSFSYRSSWPKRSCLNRIMSAQVGNYIIFLWGYMN